MRVRESARYDCTWMAMHEFIEQFDIYEENAACHHVVARMAVRHQQVLT
jgi:hypothetical protein